MKIDPRRSEAFMAAVDSGSLEQAAVRLNITPSAVSQRGAGQTRRAPVMVFDRKDTLQTQFLLQHLGLPDGAYPFHYIPASETFAQAIRLGLSYGMLPLDQCAAMLASGDLVDLAPALHADVPLYWHAWRIQPARLERMGAALVKAARAVLLPLV